MHRVSKAELIIKLQQIASLLGRSPTRRECAISTSCRKYFGSWNKALTEAGLVPHRSLNQKMYRRQICKARDGHICYSVSEWTIDNWLAEHGIFHSKEVAYPTGKHCADWKIGTNVFVEYFGLANDSKRYDIEIANKRRIYAEHGISLIELYPTDLYPQNKLNNIFFAE